MNETPPSLRLADLLTALSVATDLGIGREPTAAMRACLLATRLGDVMGLHAGQLSDVYYAALLRYIGCTAYAHEEAVLAGGDELDGRRESTRIDFMNPREFLAFHLLHVGRQEPPLRRIAAVAASIPRTLASTRDLVASHCEVGTAMARRLGMARTVQEALLQVFERWDGKGFPAGLKGESLCLPIRFAHVATFAVAYAVHEGVDVAIDVIRQRAGGMFDPAIAAVFTEHGPAFLAEMDGEDVWVAAVAAEPAPCRLIAEPEIDEIARAFADMADLKTFYTRGHSTAVAGLAESVGRRLRLSEADVAAVRRAALFHDLGRIAIPNGVWEKVGPLTSVQWEQVRLYPYHTERVLNRPAALTPIAALAGMAGERHDGSGYFRGVAGAGIPLAGRVLAASDVFTALSEVRPHRPARDRETAVAEIEKEGAAGRLDPVAVRAVLESAGARPAGRTSWPAGLSEREVEVLRLISRGSTYQDVARELVISPRTAAHHVQHIYNKIGVSTRAAAAMFAMEHNLLTH